MDDAAFVILSLSFLTIVFTLSSIFKEEKALLGCLSWVIAIIFLFLSIWASLHPVSFVIVGGSLLVVFWYELALFAIRNKRLRKIVELREKLVELQKKLDKLQKIYNLKKDDERYKRFIELFEKAKDEYFARECSSCEMTIANAEDCLSQIGLVKYRGKWGTPEEVKRWKEVDVGLSNNFAHLSPYQFEEFIVKLFQKMGYQARKTPNVGDFGADIIATKGEETILIEVKKYSEGHNVTPKEVQRTLGAMWKYKADKAVFITTSDFTVRAKELEKDAPIELWNKRILHKIVRKYFIEND